MLDGLFVICRKHGAIPALVARVTTREYASKLAVNLEPSIAVHYHESLGFDTSFSRARGFLQQNPQEISSSHQLLKQRY